MFSVYEGSVRTEAQGESVVEVLRSLSNGAAGLRGSVDIFETPDEWASWISNCYMEDGAIDPLFEETGMPSELPEGWMIVAFEGHGGESHVLSAGEPGLREVNEALSACFPDYGYRIVEE